MVLSNDSSLVTSRKPSGLGGEELRNQRTGQLMSGGNQKTYHCPANRFDYPAVLLGSQWAGWSELNSVGWPLRSLPGWLTLQLGGYHNPIARSLALVGWPWGSVAGCLTLQLSSYRCPMVGIPITAVLSLALLLLHLCPDDPTNLVQNYRLYPVWAIGPCPSLPGKMVFSGSDHVSLQENPRWVWVLANLLPRQA